MDQWLHHTQEEAALGIGLCALFLIYRRLPNPALVMLAGVALAVLIGWPMVLPKTSLLAAVALLMAALIPAWQERLPAWLASTLPSHQGAAAEAAVLVTAHPVSGKLHVFYLSRWFEAVLIDPANPPLREGETVYLIRHDARQAWVSRVRSRTSPTTTHRRWQWKSTRIRY